MGLKVPEMELIKMIKVPLTKNFFKQSTGILKLSPVQLIFVGVAVVVGAVTVLMLMQNNMSLDVIGWIVFLEMAIIIGLGVIRIGGMNLFSYFLKSMKKDKRYFNRNGVFGDDEE